MITDQEKRQMETYLHFLRSCLHLYQEQEQYFKTEAVRTSKEIRGLKRKAHYRGIELK